MRDLIGRMLERATENEPATPAARAVPTGRFARDPGHFATEVTNRPHPGATADPEQASTGLSGDGSRAEGGAA